MRFVCDSCRAQYMISDDKVGPKGVKVRCKKCGFVILVKRPEASVPAPAVAAAAAGAFDDGDEPPERTQIMKDPLALLAAAGHPVGEPTTSIRATMPLGEPAPTPVRSPILTGVEEDEIGAVFDQALRAGPAAPAPSISSDDEPTVARDPQPGLSGAPSSDDDEDDDHAQTRILDLGMVRKLTQETGASPREPERNGGATPASADRAADHEWYVAVNDNQVGPIDAERVKALWNSGEIGPDSLCWRVGFADWVPLSDAAELASLLAPRPSKPAIVAPVAASATRGPVESVFSASSSGRAGGMQAGGEEELTSGGWKPAAALELASLVKEEIEALNKSAAPKGAPASGGQAGGEPPPPGLMDVPSAEYPLPNGAARQEAPARAPELNGYARPSYSGYRPPPPPPPTFLSRNRVTVGLAVAGALVIGLLVAILVMLANPKAPAITVNVPTPASPAEAPPPKKQRERQERVETAPPKPEAAPAVAAPPVQPSVQPSPAASGAPVALPPVRSLPSERRGGRTARSPKVNDDDEVGSFTAGSSKPAPPPPDPSASDDDFEREFGGSRPTSVRSSGGKRGKPPTTYVPPAPGSADIPESLGQSDVIQVVVQHKPAILKCVEEQKKADSGTSGRLVMRWTILPSGKVTQVSAQTSEFKSTAMASCLARLIPTWTFPRHRSQGPPIDFPFTF